MAETFKQYDPTHFFKGVKIPDDWDTLEDFVQWFMNSRMPIMIPWDAEVIRSDDAVAICIFRKGNYQVEFYLEFPYMYIKRHSHPRMEVITMSLGGGGLRPPLSNVNKISSAWGSMRKKLLPGMYHGGEVVNQASTGFCTLAFQRWENPEEMSSAAVQWKGEIYDGGVQASLIKRHYKNAKIEKEYADITAEEE